MIERDSTEKTTKTQHVVADTTKLHLIGDKKHDYDVDQVTEFLEMVFESGVKPGAHRLVYQSRNNNPGMPLTGVAGLIKFMSRTSKARAMYFNASSCIPDPLGKLRHKRDLFSAFHVLVLDDVGTKIPFDRVPENMPPTYKIESSKGNFQYGYVLQEAIDNFEHATALVQCAAMAGLTDGGGVMATKIVRLPEGINGKPDPLKRDFKVNLVDMAGPFWTPELLLERINLEIDGDKVLWPAIVAGEIEPLSKKHRTKFMPLTPISQTAEGVIDPMLEWLYQNDMVLADSGGEWVDIKCPWGHTHTTGDDGAGYSPLGRGDRSDMRAFNCFHEHCSDHHTKELIQYVLSNSDFSCMPIRDPSAEIFNRYVFEESNNRVWLCDPGCPPLPIDINGFKTKYNTPITAFKPASGGGLATQVTTPAQIWLQSPYRTVVQGALHEPGGDTLSKDKNGRLWVNTYMPPPWGTGDFDMGHVDKFIAFLEYLIPIEKERQYFIDWLAAQTQDPTFRGTGIIMATEAYGTGRSTLGNMVSELMGRHNSSNVDFDTLLSTGGFNPWASSQLVVVSEALETVSRTDAKGAHKAYEVLKQVIDTTASWGTLNLKYQNERQILMCASFLIFTNHLGAIAVPQEDRRLTVLQNVGKPESPAYFTKLNAWIGEIDGNRDPVWAKHVYRWLRTLKVDTAKLHLPLETAGKQRMTEESRTIVEQICSAIEESCVKDQNYYIATSQFSAIIAKALVSLRVDTEYKNAYMTRCMKDVSAKFNKFRMRVEGQESATHPRVFKQSVARGLDPHFDVNDLNHTGTGMGPALAKKVAASVKAVDTQRVLDYILDNVEK